jgi:hypothetical protein
MAFPDVNTLMLPEYSQRYFALAARAAASVNAEQAPSPQRSSADDLPGSS